MDSARPLRIEDLEEMCNERTEESLILEFKPCDELRVGTHMKDGNLRTRDTILDELTRDVSAFLNSAGGTIIYGIRESNSCAKKLDRKNAFKPDDESYSQPERVIQFLRYHIQPAPTVNVYRVFDKPGNAWYLVIEIPQGQQAYMARKHIFYKRVGNITQPMEQYEVADVMNRTRAAALALRVDIRGKLQPTNNKAWNRLLLDFTITSTNFVASEHGALKLTLARPSKFGESVTMSFSGSDIDLNTGLVLDEENDVPHAQSIRARWGVYRGNLVFPGDWYNPFYGNPLDIDLPSSLPPPLPIYLIQAELFTINSQPKKKLYAIRPGYQEIFEVDSSNHDEVIASFWTTYHDARALKIW
jgi:hypothetical protein